jgi:hypothetical protein
MSVMAADITTADVKASKEFVATYSFTAKSATNSVFLIMMGTRPAFLTYELNTASTLDAVPFTIQFLRNSLFSNNTTRLGWTNRTTTGAQVANVYDLKNLHVDNTAVIPATTVKVDNQQINHFGVSNLGAIFQTWNYVVKASVVSPIREMKDPLLLSASNTYALYLSNATDAASNSAIIFKIRLRVE